MAEMTAGFSAWARSWLARGRGESVALSAARVFSATCALGIAIASARQLGPSQRGEIVLSMTVVMLLTELTSLGTNVSGRIRILRRSGTAIEDVVGLTVVLTVAQGFAVGSTLLVIHETLGVIRFSLIPMGVLLGVSVFQAHMLTDAAFAVHRSLAVCYRDTVVGLLPLIVVFFLALSHRLSVENVVGLMALGYAVGDGYLWTVVLRHCDRIRLAKMNWAELVRSGLPVLAANFFQMLALRVDRLILGLAVAAGSLGIFSIAATAAEAPRLLLIATTQILANRIAIGAINQRSFLWLVGRLLALYGLLLVGVGLLVPHLVVFVVGPGFSEAKSLIPILLVSEVFLGIYMVMVSALTGRERFTRLPAPSAAGAVVLLVAGLILGPGGGATTVAWVRVVAYGTMAVWSVWSVWSESRWSQRSGL